MEEDGGETERATERHPENETERVRQARCSMCDTYVADAVQRGRRPGTASMCPSVEYLPVAGYPEGIDCTHKDCHDNYKFCDKATGARHRYLPRPYLYSISSIRTIILCT